MYGVQLYIDGKWVLVETKDLKLTNRVHKRAVERKQYPARRVLIIEGSKPIPLDATA